MNHIPIIAEAKTLAEEGFAVFPTFGKRPALKGWQDAATDDPDAVEDLFMGVMDNGIGIGIATGKGLVVLDIDRDTPQVRALLKRLPETRTVKTRHGAHLYFSASTGYEPVANRARIFPSIDVRGDGGLVIAPPSTGKRYFDRREPAPCPEFLMRKIISKKSEPLTVPRIVASTIPSDLPKPIPSGLARIRHRILHAPQGHQAKTLFKGAVWAGANLAGPGRYPHEACRAYLIASGQSMHDFDPEDRWTIEAITRQVDRGLAAGLRAHKRNTARWAQ